MRDEVQKGIHILIAPDIFPYELAHALTRAERQGRITLGQAIAQWANVLSTPPLLAAGLALTHRAITISSAARVGVYDCLYVALAEREGCPFVTAGDKLIKNLQPTFPFITSLASLP